MGEKRQKNQEQLAFPFAWGSEASRSEREGTEAPRVKRETEDPAENQRVMEEVCEGENRREALKRVRANQGSPGIDGMTVDELPEYLEQHWPAVREQLLSGTYEPKPVKRVEIPKPDGGVRKLGIPTVLDRFVQQAVQQVLQKQWDPTFSEHSYGFRPGRSTQQAVAQAQRYIAEGHGWCVDFDLEKFFDRVNHDKLMGAIAKRVEDKRLLKLIRAFLNAGVMEDVKRFITEKLKLKVNESKSAVAKPQERKFLGFSFTSGKELKRKIAPKAIDRFKERVREITHKSRGRSMEKVMEELAPYLRGWRGYFGFCETPAVLRHLDSWIRRRVRCEFWRQWKTGRKRFAELVRRGVSRQSAAKAAGSRGGPWRVSQSPALNQALSNAYLASLGLPSLVEGR